MAQKSSSRGRPSADAVRDATGREWDDWFLLLDQAGAPAWDHKKIVQHLGDLQPPVESIWWRQSIAVAYEKERGKRVTGQTADAGFQVGVQRTINAASAKLWNLLVSRPSLWLGGVSELELTKGARYEVAGEEPARGEIRVVKPGERIRMTWQPEGWSAPAVLQITLTGKSEEKTALGIHLEKLPDADARKRMREHWSAILTNLAEESER